MWIVCPTVQHPTINLYSVYLLLLLFFASAAAVIGVFGFFFILNDEKVWQK